MATRTGTSSFLAFPGYDHVSAPNEYYPSLDCAPLVIYLAQVCAVTGISPPQLSIDASAAPALCYTSPKFLSHFIPSRIVSPLDFSATYGFGKSSSQASSSWVLLNPEYRRLVFFKLSAREMPNRALRAAPPIWEYITLQYASNVLNLASLSQGTRSHYEKLLHERH